MQVKRCEARLIARGCKSDQVVCSPINVIESELRRDGAMVTQFVPEDSSQKIKLTVKVRASKSRPNQLRYQIYRKKLLFFIPLIPQALFCRPSALTIACTRTMVSIAPSILACQASLP